MSRRLLLLPWRLPWRHLGDDDNASQVTHTGHLRAKGQQAVRGGCAGLFTPITWAGGCGAPQPPPAPAVHGSRNHPENYARAPCGSKSFAIMKLALLFSHNAAVRERYRVYSGRPTHGTIRYAGQAPRGGGSVRSTMMDVPLTITSIMRYGTSVFGTARPSPGPETGPGAVPTPKRAAGPPGGERPARPGRRPDQRVGTFMWNNAEHLQPTWRSPRWPGLHTLNIRLAAADVGDIATHAKSGRDWTLRLPPSSPRSCPALRPSST